MNHDSDRGNIIPKSLHRAKLLTDDIKFLKHKFKLKEPSPSPETLNFVEIIMNTYKTNPNSLYAYLFVQYQGQFLGRANLELKRTEQWFRNHIKNYKSSDGGVDSWNFIRLRTKKENEAFHKELVDKFVVIKLVIAAITLTALCIVIFGSNGAQKNSV